jgi:hypothetical protein
MVLQTINIGTSANDGTGDPLRTAMDKVNEQLLENLSRKDVAPIRGYPYNLRAYDGVFVIFVVVYMKEYPYADTSTPIS